MSQVALYSPWACCLTCAILASQKKTALGGAVSDRPECSKLLLFYTRWAGGVKREKRDGCASKFLPSLSPLAKIKPFARVVVLFATTFRQKSPEQAAHMARQRLFTRVRP